MLRNFLFMLPFYAVTAWAFYIIVRTEIVIYRRRQELKIAKSQEDRKAVIHDPDGTFDIAVASGVYQDLTRSKAFQL